MSIGLFIFIFYILIILFSWLQNQIKKSSILNQKKDETIVNQATNQDKVKLPEYSDNYENIKDIEDKDKIIIDDEVKEFYEQQEIKHLTNKPLVIDEEDFISNQKNELREYLSNNIFINGIILSEILAPPRAVKPYKFKRKNRFV
ncbi:MAG: hypothetical protein COZ07_03255 [Candidatus Infernicultor aquiphilus]|uniref:Uncharacterized protein n=1 Tax=Candidatus Infernicultor aquiphilus TaxID=1805029 RepID=A0A2M7K9A3_9BACT|nr:hypothetical protein [bacterium]PIU25394.1 MAG: hypothetical protein COT11_03065 [Candidatus Atribacteria bacterium CG08_land_8_20_14_0_20_33_29]PIW12033.1 MAG: hypothetical protein COW35_03605 [Candidatus Atribacteria bacterium CG17_big_fil_post_rev_8_21_14_2_50_34_11]PIX34718.1 MAG: hypothetical protein COZ58_02740 [Candidatus Atribacteria bacterium CG_4_8_14_3_um_filter_34_18]PIY33176.1 MAG: hypothetical protein COZ07_03255 [Candidatus Atribacteria bacterium CG_4_10_14_3_um_filter_34_13]